MIQDIVYAIKYDRLESLNLTDFFIQNLELKIESGQVSMANHPVILCLENKKPHYINFFIEKGFHLNALYNKKSFLYNTLSLYGNQKYFLALYERGASFCEKEKKEALKALCLHFNSFNYTISKFIKIAEILIEKNYYENLTPILTCSYQLDSIHLFDLVYKKDSNLVEKNAMFGLKLSLESNSLKVVEKILDLYSEKINVERLDLTFVDKSALEFIQSYQLKMKLENDINLPKTSNSKLKI